jgi:ribosomal-protein-alanine acetyltransferase
MMMALERATPSAAHWPKQQYEIAVSGRDRVALVIEEESTPEGFIVVRTIDREWEIENILVACDRRRRGLGARLLAEIINGALPQHVEAIFLEVRESNLAARSFYEKSGFVQIGRRVQYYREPEENALVYRWQIP